MDNQFSEELVTGNHKTKINLYLLIFLSLIIIILIIIIIVLSVKLNNKSKDHKDLKRKYESQNNTLNDIFHTFQNLISATNITHNNINRDNYIKVMEKVREKVKNLEEGTYDFVTNQKESFKTGFHVDFETPSRNSTNYYNEIEYDDIVYKLSCLFGRDVHINYYEKIPHISYYCEDRNFAFAMGALFNQRYIWDWKAFKDIPNPFFLPDFF